MIFSRVNQPELSKTLEHGAYSTLGGLECVFILLAKSLSLARRG